MKRLDILFKTETGQKTLLFLCSFAIYFFYFHPILLNLNSVVSSVSLDTLKNYYTFIYHVKHDPAPLHFEGLFYPYGEHVVYTDCQPVLTFILRAVPFSHAYAIGIMHFLIFFSYIVSPVILFNLFRKLGIQAAFSFFVALGISLLSPQFLKINAGHHALAYGCLIPYSFLLTFRFMNEKQSKRAIGLFVYHCFLFLLHPYMGFSICLFSFMALLFYSGIKGEVKEVLKRITVISLVCLVPIILFKLFMMLTDRHSGRTEEPYGVEVMTENFDSLLAPVFGPFKAIMETWFNKRPEHFEGHTYLGITSILLALLMLLLLVFNFKKIRINRAVFSLFLSSFLLLMLAFGLHNWIAARLGLELGFMKQFRAACRFAWFFYFGFAIFLVSTIHHFYSDKINRIKIIQNGWIAGLLFFGINLVEAHYMFRLDEKVFWRFRNIFNENLLSDSEKKIIHDIRQNTQAIVPLPVYFSGSEMYDRTGFNKSMLASMFYSAHSGVPVFSALLSRTSIPETENLINLLNSYKKVRPAADLLTEKPFAILKTNDELMPDEQRLLSKINFVSNNDTLSFGYLSKSDLLARKNYEGGHYDIETSKTIITDSLNLIYIKTADYKPFISASQLNAEVIFRLDSNKVAPGIYSVSFRYYYTGKNFRSLACNLIVTEGNKTEYKWKYDVPVRILSGFYDGFAVFEWPVEIKEGMRYEFFIQGRVENTYRVSDFLLRPLNKEVNLIDTQKKDTACNNFPG